VARPRRCSTNHVYADVGDEVLAFSGNAVRRSRVRGRCRASRRRPGIGFGKSVEHNLSLFRRQQDMLAIGRPLLARWPSKSTLGAVTRQGRCQTAAASVCRKR